VLLSVHHAAGHRLRKARKTARRSGAAQPPWKSSLGWKTARRSSASPVSLLTRLVVLVAVLWAISLVRPASAGIFASATVSTLEVLWQVQSASVGLVFTLVIFVFGLLPQGRGRLTYRQFLRRTSAVNLTIFNVASLLFNGLVLLGAGHQVASTASVAGHGWAVTVASVTAMLSIASIVVLLAQTIRALDPVMNKSVQADYRRLLTADAVRQELRERESLAIVDSLAEPGTDAFSPIYNGSGVNITTRSGRDGVVRDVSVWRFKLLGWQANRKSLPRPVLRAWPGRRVTAETPLMTIAPSSGPVAQWWARGCVRTSAIPADELATALNALHADTLDDIRAARPVEALEGMQALAELHQVIWQAFQSHGKTYGQDALQTFHFYRWPVGEQLMMLLEDELRAAAVSEDNKIRGQATLLPHRLAAMALAAQAGGTIQSSLGTLLGTYATIVNVLTSDGQQPLPVTQISRNRILSPFQALLTFTSHDVLRVIEQAAVLDRDKGPTPQAIKIARSAEFGSSQLQVAHRQVMVMLQYAIRLGDSATVREVLDAWKVPEIPRVRDVLSEQADLSPKPAGLADQGENGLVPPLWQLARSLAAAQDDLNAMLLRLLPEALRAESGGRRAGARADEDATDAPASNAACPQRRDPVVTILLDHLPAGQLWQALETALSPAADRFSWPLDEGRLVTGVTISELPDTTSPALEAFTLAAITRPLLIGETRPSPESAMADGALLSTAVDRVLAERLPWLLRYGVPEESARQAAAVLKDRITAAAQDARRQQNDRIRSAPVREETVERIRKTLISAFRVEDITRPILSSAQEQAPTAALEQEPARLCVFISASVPRIFLTGDHHTDSDASRIGKWLGRSLAQALLSYLLGTAAAGVKSRGITRADGAAAVQDAITELRDGPDPGGAGPRPHSGKVVVFIPDGSYDLMRDIGVAATEADSWNSTEQRREREQVAASLGLSGGLSQLAGMIGGVPVFGTPMLRNMIVILDLSKLGKIVFPGDDNQNPGEPALALIRSAHAPPAGMAADWAGSPPTPRPAAGRGTDQEQATSGVPGPDDVPPVKFKSWVIMETAMSAPGSARTLTWEEWR